MFEAEQLTEPILLCGVELPASEATMFEDLQVLSRAYVKEKPQIRYQKKPVYTMVATSSSWRSISACLAASASSFFSMFSFFRSRFSSFC